MAGWHDGTKSTVDSCVLLLVVVPTAAAVVACCGLWAVGCGLWAMAAFVNNSSDQTCHGTDRLY